MGLKSKRKIVMACSQCQSRNYTTVKNAVVHPIRLELKKFCPKCTGQTLHKETK
jgi:large subunit ribosomal protein L33